MNEEQDFNIPDDHPNDIELKVKSKVEVKLSDSESAAPGGVVADNS